MKQLICCLCIFWSLNAFAQQEIQRNTNPPYKLAVNINPLTLMNYDQRLMAGVEVHLKKRWTALIDVGAVVHSGYIDNHRRSPGLELRPAIRYYYDRDFAGYIQLQAQYRRVHYRVYDWLGKDCVAGVPAYEQLQDFTFQKQQTGGALVTGGVIKLSQQLLLDISVGFGAQYRSHQVKNKDNCCYMPRAGFWGNQRAEDLWILIFPATLKLVYVIR